jgi:hypothetical protein
MSALHFAMHHVWWAVGAVVVLAALAVVFRRKVKRALRLARAAATDKRLPPSVRWCFRIALLAKAMPLDFGIDELALAVGLALLLTRHRATWRTICAEIT